MPRWCALDEDRESAESGVSHPAFLLSAPVDILTVGDPEHEHDQPIVVDLAHHSVVADADSPKVLVARQLHQ